MATTASEERAYTQEEEEEEPFESITAPVQSAVRKLTGASAPQVLAPVRLIKSEPVLRLDRQSVGQYCHLWCRTASLAVTEDCISFSYVV